MAAAKVSGAYTLYTDKDGSENLRRSRLLDVYALCAGKSGSANALPAPDGLDLVHAHLLAYKSSFSTAAVFYSRRMSQAEHLRYRPCLHV